MENMIEKEKSFGEKCKLVTDKFKAIDSKKNFVFRCLDCNTLWQSNDSYRICPKCESWHTLEVKT